MNYAARVVGNNPTARGIHLLYISYWGIREPLGQALMVPPLLRFAEAGLKITLVTFEKPQHLADSGGMEESRRQLSAVGIRWLPLRYHKTPTALATAWDIAHGSARSILASLPRRPDIVHGRTYPGGLIGGLVSRTLRRPFVFHNEGFWPDEQIDGGMWAADCWPYRATKRIELELYYRADAVITLSQPAHEIVAALRGHKPPSSTAVVPSCVNRSPFARSLPKREARDVYRLVYIGSLGGRYRIHEMARFFKAARQEMPAAHLTIYSHSDPNMIRTAMRGCGVEDGWWSLDYVPHTEMHQAMATQHAGLFFLSPGISARVCSPTKIGEYWACGLPVVTTPQVGDVDAIVRRERVGVIVEEDSDEACRVAARQLRELLADPELPQRCRYAAERYYSLDCGVETQIRLYQSLVSRA